MNLLRRFWPLLLLAGLVAVFLWDSLFTGGVIVTRDTFCDYLPWRRFAAQSWAAGEVPRWNAGSRFGQPFLAQPQSAVFYPPHLIFQWTTLPRALAWTLALHLFLAATGMFVLLRRWTLDHGPALLGAVAFAFGTYLVAALEFLSILETVAWCPWTLVAVDAVVVARGGPPAGRGARTYVATSGLVVVLAVSFLAGHSQTFAMNLLVAVAFLVARTVGSGDRRRLLTSVAACAVALVVALGLTAFQLLPTVDLIPSSVRGVATDGGMAEASVGLGWWWTLVDPFAFGTPGYGGTWHDENVFEFWLDTAHVGWPALLAAGAATVLWRGRKFPRRAIAWFGVAVVAVGFVTAMGDGTPVYPLLYEYAPVFDRFRWPAKFLYLVAFGLPVLAALGLQSVQDSTAAERLGKAARWIAPAVVAVSFVNLFVVGRQIHPVMDASVFTARPTWIDRVRASGGRLHSTYSRSQVFLYGSRDPELFRWAREASVGDALLGEGIDRTWGGGTLKLLDPYRTVDRLPSLAPWQRERLADVLGIRWLLTGPPLDRRHLTGELPPPRPTLVERPNPLPRIYAVDGWRWAADQDEVTAHLLDPAFDPRRECVRMRDPEGDGSEVARSPSPTAPEVEVVNLRDGPGNRVSLDVDVDRPCLLVMTDVWTGDLRESRDSREVERVNGIFRAVAVKPGRSHLEIDGVPRAHAVGRLWSLVVAVLWFVLIPLGWRLHRRLGRRLRRRLSRRDAS